MNPQYDTVFVDSLLSVKVAKGVARVLFGTITEPPAGQEGKTVMRPSLELLMPASSLKDLSLALDRTHREFEEKARAKRAE